MTLEPVHSKLELDKVLDRILRYTTSEPGAEVVRRLPLFTSPDEIRDAMARISEMKSLLTDEPDFPIQGVFAIRGALQKTAIEGARLAPVELLHVASTLRTIRLVKSFIAQRRERYAMLAALVEPMTVDKVLEYNIGEALDETGVVRSEASRELRSIRRAITETYDQLRTRMAHLLKGLGEQGFTQDDIITTREGRMVLPVKAEHKNRVHGFIHSASASGATVFIEPTETLELNNDIRNLQFQEQREIDRILSALTAQVREIRPALAISLDAVATLDALYAKAKYSMEILGNAPGVSGQGPIRLVGARHPGLILNHGYQRTIPLDIDLGDEYTTLLISGPNAGGKSVALKTVGLLTLMVQAGLHIPAAPSSSMRTFSRLFLDIGDEQSIENDLSTFSSHLKNLKEIVSDADADSLVLIDEIGSGTDPTEGGAIAAAVLEALTRKGVVTIATTHHGALKRFAHETPGVANGAMEFDQETLTPTYRFSPGIPGSSYALQMAGRLGFDRRILERARELMGDEQASLERLLTDLEATGQQNKKEAAALAEERLRIDAMTKEYAEKIASLREELRTMKRDAVAESRTIVDNANAAIENAIRRIKEGSASTGSIRAAHHDLGQLRENIHDMEEDIRPPQDTDAQPSIHVGSAVRLQDSKEVGEVEAISDGKASVVFGNLKMRVPLSTLAIAQRRPSGGAAPVAVSPTKEVEAATDLDLRGLTGDEALPLVEKFIDQAILAGLFRVDIIHGKGTGALRKKVTAFLAEHPKVRSFRLGEWNEGGTGATVVELLDE